MKRRASQSKKPTKRQKKAPQGPKAFYSRPLFWLVSIAILVPTALYFGVDEKVVALVAIVTAFLTQAFAALAGLIALIPFFGPIIVKLFSIPLFWLISAVGNLISAVAVKQGYGKQMGSSKLLALILFVGLVVGYLFGHWFPMR